MNTTIHIIEHLNWNLLMLNIMHIFTLVKKLITKILSLKLVIMLEYQNTKNIVAKGYTLNWSEKVLIGKIKNTVPWRYVVNDLNDKEIIGSFY